MTKITVSYVFKPEESFGLEEETVMKALERQLKDEIKRQNATIRFNKDIDCLEKTIFSNASARKFQIPTINFKEVKNGLFNQNEMTKSEAFRVIKGWQQKLKIYEELKSSNFEKEYSDRSPENKYVKYQHWDNIKKSGKKPSLPNITSPRLVLSKTASQYSWLDQSDRELLLFLKTIAGECSIKFTIPKKVWSRYQGFKVSKPNIELRDDNVVFVFSLQGEIEKHQFSKSVLGVDLGLSRPYAAAKITGTETTIISSESLEVTRDFRALNKLNKQLYFVSKKNQRRKKLGVENIQAILEESRLRSKRHRIIESLDWQISKDIVDFAGKGTTIALENLSWAAGGSVKFRHGLQQQKIEHQARKNSCRIKKVDARNTSKTCPNCGSHVTSDAKRITTCDCGFSEDRDTSASIVIAQRCVGSKLTLKKSQPTPKQLKPRKKIIRILKRIESTGSNPTTPTSQTTASVVAGYRTPVSPNAIKWRKQQTYW